MKKYELPTKFAVIFCMLATAFFFALTADEILDYLILNNRGLETTAIIHSYQPVYRARPRVRHYYVIEYAGQTVKKNLHRPNLGPKVGIIYDPENSDRFRVSPLRINPLSYLGGFCGLFFACIGWFEWRRRRSASA